MRGATGRWVQWSTHRPFNVSVRLTARPQAHGRTRANWGLTNIWYGSIMSMRLRTRPDKLARMRRQ